MGQQQRNARRGRAITLAAGLVLSGCIHPIVQPHEATRQSCVPVATWMAPADGLQRSRSEVLRQASAGSFVLLGEVHDNAMHHAWQLDMLSGLYALRQRLVIGLEMLPRAAQPVLDAWVRGDIDEETFLRQSGWREYWHFDVQLYLPILRFARLNRIPIYALNVDKALLASVRQRGWSTLSTAERGGITDPARPPESYLMTLAASFMLHGAHAKEPEQAPAALERVRADPAFQRFVETQLLWDRAMAEGLVQARQTHPEALVVGLMGSGHLMEGDGVPWQLAQLQPSKAVVLLPWEEVWGCTEFTEKLADAVFMLAPWSAEQGVQRPRLGVRIESVEGGVKVIEVVDKSVAQAAGIQAGDVLISAAGGALAAPENLIERVQNMLPGAWLPIRVRRHEQELDIVAKFPVVAP